MDMEVTRLPMCGGVGGRACDSQLLDPQGSASRSGWWMGVPGGCRGWVSFCGNGLGLARLLVSPNNHAPSSSPRIHRVVKSLLGSGESHVTTLDSHVRGWALKTLASWTCVVRDSPGHAIHAQGTLECKDAVELCLPPQLERNSVLLTRQCHYEGDGTLVGVHLGGLWVGYLSLSASVSSAGTGH